MNKGLTLKPLLSEKSYALSEERNTYVFVVSPQTNRQQIAKSVSTQFAVTVEKVRLAAQPAKKRSTFNRRSRRFNRGQTSPARKAYVRLKEGDKLPIFSANEDAKKPKEPRE